MIHILRNARLYSPKNEGIQHLLIAGSSIAYCGTDIPDVDSNLVTSDTDLEGRVIIPGLIDAHTHTTGGGGESGYSSRVPAVPLTQFTRAGVTSVVGLLGTDDTVRSTSSLIAQTYSLREEGLNAWCYTGGYHFPLTTLTGSVRSDIVHVECIIGVGELAISDHRSSQPSLDEVVRVAGDAHVAGLMTGKAGIVHFHLGDGDRKLALIERALCETEIPARVFNPTHVNRNKALFEHACELSHQGITVDLTASPESEDLHDDSWSATSGFLRYKEGGHPMDKITISSDGGGCLPIFNEAGELQSLDFGRSMELNVTLRSLIEQGELLEDVLPAMTSNPAALLRLRNKGRIGVGFDADIVILDDKYIPRSVMIRGVWHIKDDLTLLKGAFES